MRVYDLSMDKVVIGLRVRSSMNPDIEGVISCIDADGEARVQFENGVVNKFVGHNSDLEVIGWDRICTFPDWRKV